MRHGNEETSWTERRKVGSAHSQPTFYHPARRCCCCRITMENPCKSLSRIEHHLLFGVYNFRMMNFMCISQFSPWQPDTAPSGFSHLSLAKTPHILSLSRSIIGKLLTNSQLIWTIRRESIIDFKRSQSIRLCICLLLAMLCDWFPSWRKNLKNLFFFLFISFFFSPLNISAGWVRERERCHSDISWIEHVCGFLLQKTENKK